MLLIFPSGPHNVGIGSTSKVFQHFSGDASGWKWGAAGMNWVGLVWHRYLIPKNLLLPSNIWGNPRGVVVHLTVFIFSKCYQHHPAPFVSSLELTLKATIGAAFVPKNLEQSFLDLSFLIACDCSFLNQTRAHAAKFSLVTWRPHWKGPKLLWRLWCGHCPCRYLCR